MGWAGLLIAAIWAITKGTINVVDYNRDFEDNQSELEKQMENLRDSYFQAQENANDEYEAAKKAANDKANRLEENADIQDTVLNTEEKVLSDQFNAGIDQLQAEQEANLFNWNNALASIGANTGNELAAAANSGTRAGSSLSQAIDLEAAANSAALSLQISNAERQQKITLQNLYNQNMSGQNSIWQGRVGADQNRYDATDLRNSYEEGGMNWQLQQDKLNTLRLNYHQNKSALVRQYNKNNRDKGWNTFAAFFGTQGNDFNGALNVWNTANNAFGGK